MAMAMKACRISSLRSAAPSAGAASPSAGAPRSISHAFLDRCKKSKFTAYAEFLAYRITVAGAFGTFIAAAWLKGDMQKINGEAVKMQGNFNNVEERVGEVEGLVSRLTGRPIPTPASRDA